MCIKLNTTSNCFLAKFNKDLTQSYYWFELRKRQYVLLQIKTYPGWPFQQTFLYNSADIYTQFIQEFNRSKASAKQQYFPAKADQSIPCFHSYRTSWRVPGRSFEAQSKPGTKMMNPEPCKELERRISATISGWDCPLPSSTRVLIVLGVPSPFFPGILLSRKPPETQGK